MDSQIKKLVEQEINNLDSIIERCNKEIESLTKQIQEAELQKKKVQFMATKPCTLNKSCISWESCWRSNKRSCGNCSSFESEAQYEERMDKAYAEMSKYGF